ncbi:MAG: class I SAM-dependent methyltransferase [Bacteroidetes bacterium]|nr:class I SAM-dependent methyltransferase [Bacteroidota bacterium]
MKKLKTYLRYFFFLGFNWNFRIAVHIIKKEIKGEKKYGITTTGSDNLNTLEAKDIDIDHATIYMPVSYDILEEIFRFLKTLQPLPQKHFIDIGCGMGRALCVAAHHGFLKVTGVDFSKDFCLTAEKNLSSTASVIKDFSYHVYNNDAFYFPIPSDADCIFLFNPFDDVIMQGVAENIQESFEEHPRPIRLIYVNPQFKDIFTGYGFKEIFHFQKLKYLEAVVLELTP